MMFVLFIKKKKKKWSRDAAMEECFGPEGWFSARPPNKLGDVTLIQTITTLPVRSRDHGGIVWINKEVSWWVTSCCSCQMGSTSDVRCIFSLLHQLTFLPFSRRL